MNQKKMHELVLPFFKITFRHDQKNKVTFRAMLNLLFQCCFDMSKALASNVLTEWVPPVRPDKTDPRVKFAPLIPKGDEDIKLHSIKSHILLCVCLHPSMCVCGCCTR